MTRTLAPAVVGDTHSPQTITWENQDLTAATLSAVKKNLDTGVVTAVTGAFAVTNATSGIFTWTYGAADTETAGRYLVQFTATYATKQDSSSPASWLVYPLYTVIVSP